jgi:hypothetical protein
MTPSLILTVATSGSINGLTAALEGLVAGLLHLVGQLLVAVAALLNRLGIDLENF